MSTPGAFGFACLLGVVLSFYSPWVITLIVSVLLFAVALGGQLMDGEGLGRALLIAAALLAALQASYIVAGQVFPSGRSFNGYVKTPRDEHNAG